MCGVVTKFLIKTRRLRRDSLAYCAILSSSNTGAICAIQITTDQISDAIVRLAEDRSLAGRVLVWWSEGAVRLIEWGDRGYRDLVDF